MGQPLIVVALFCNFLCHFFLFACLLLLVHFSLQISVTILPIVFNNTICSDSVLLELAVTASVSLSAAYTTVSSGGIIGEVRYLCLKNSVLTILSDLVCLMHTLND